jgi:hypothetical protein
MGKDNETDKNALQRITDEAEKYINSESVSVDLVMNMKLEEFLSELNKNHFYIMHLSYAGEEKERLWDYGKENRLIGLDHRLVTDYWLRIRDRVKHQLDPVWVNQFNLFCEDMHIGDIVLALDGCEYLLGIAEIKENVAKYKKNLQGVFFDHVRLVDWILAYDYDKSTPLPHALDRFTNTLRRVDAGKRYWNDLAPLQINISQVSEPIRRTRILRVRKYGSGGEGIDHKKLKEWIAVNPDVIGLRNVRKTTVEYTFPSGDTADIVFELENDRYTVVEIETSDPLPGCYQALKYRTLKCAELGMPITSSIVEAIVVAWDFQPYIEDFCSSYAIKHCKYALQKANSRAISSCDT